jgi:hypothetical protein
MKDVLLPNPFPLRLCRLALRFLPFALSSMLFALYPFTFLLLRKQRSTQLLDPMTPQVNSVPLTIQQRPAEPFGH